MKKIRKILLILLSCIALCSVNGIIASASELDEIEMKLKDFDFHTGSDGISLMDEAIPAADAYARSNNYYPALTSGTHTKWIDRIDISADFKQFYKNLEQGANNDGINDFLIDPFTGNLVNDFQTYYYDDNDEIVRGTSRVIKITTVSVTSYNTETIMDEFYDQYSKNEYTAMAVYEAFMLDHPEAFWLFPLPYIDMSDPVVEQLNNGAYKVSCNLYFTLHFKDTKGNLLFDIRHGKYDTNTIRNTYREIVSIADSIIKKVKHSDTAAKIKYFNKYLTMNNERNTYFDESPEKQAELFYESPDSYSCVSALRGVTGKYGPTDQAYAFAFQFLCNHAGIPATIVSGINSWTGHTSTIFWNYVQVDGTWYGVHCGWNDMTSKTGMAVSGDESVTYLLLGKNSKVEYPGLELTYSSAFRVTNDYFTGLEYKNGPSVGNDSFEYSLISLHINPSESSYIYGYTNAPVVNARAVVRGGYSGEPTYKWFLVDPNNNIRQVGDAGTCTYVSPGIYECSIEFPEVTQPGVYRIISEVQLAGRTKRNETSIEVTIFQDVNESHWFYHAVDWALKKGITYGLNNSTFGSTAPCTRAQIVTFLWRAAGSPEPVNTANVFQDVKSDAYYYDAVLWAVENGITSGYSADRFAPDNSCTRAEMVTFLWRVGGKKEVEDKVHPYQDVKADGFYYDAMLWAVENGIAAGYTETKFAPNVTVTRAETVTFLYRANGNPLPTDKKDGPSKILENKELYKDNTAIYHIPDTPVDGGYAQNIAIYENHVLTWNFPDLDNNNTFILTLMDMTSGNILQQRIFADTISANVYVCNEEIAVHLIEASKLVFLDGGLKTLREVDLTKYENVEYPMYLDPSGTKLYRFIQMEDKYKLQVINIETDEIKVLMESDEILSGSHSYADGMLFKRHKDISMEGLNDAVYYALDYETDEIVEFPLQASNYLILRYKKGIWSIADLKDDKQYLVIDGELHQIAFDTDNYYISFLDSSDFISVSYADEDGTKKCNLYTLDGTFVSSGEYEETAPVIREPQYSEKDNGLYLISVDDEKTGEILLFWDLSIEMEGEDLQFEKVFTEED